MDRRGNGENDMKVRHRQQVSRLGLDPLSLVETLTFWTLAIPAGIVDRSLVATLVAHLDVAAQDGRPTRNDVADHSTALSPELLHRRSMCSEDFGQVGGAARGGRPRPTPRGLLH